MLARRLFFARAMATKPIPGGSRLDDVTLAHMLDLRPSRDNADQPTFEALQPKETVDPNLVPLHEPVERKFPFQVTRFFFIFSFFFFPHSGWLCLENAGHGPTHESDGGRSRVQLLGAGRLGRLKRYRRLWLRQGHDGSRRRAKGEPRR